MNKTQLKSIEKKCKVALPEWYREFLLSPPSILEAVLNQEEKEGPGQSSIFLNHEDIINCNQMMRDTSHPEHFEFGPSDDPEPWPDQYFIVGSDIGGNFYCIKPESGKSSVHFWYQGNNALERYTKDFAAYVKKIFKDHAQFAAEEITDRE